MKIGLDSGLTTGAKRIAVVGSGISGLSCAWLLSKGFDVTVFEAENRFGGHANTVNVAGPNGPVAVDTGFIVYNDRNYPNLVALFDHLGVPNQASDMSFAASLDAGRFEYSGCGLAGLLGQRSNAIRPRFWRMVADIMRFYREAPLLLERQDLTAATLGDYLDLEAYSNAFIEDHLLPMGAAIWSTTAADMRAYPLNAFVRFFINHGLVTLKNRPQWRTVTGGSREYVLRIKQATNADFRANDPVKAIIRSALGVKIVTQSGYQDRFDQVVVATHADETLALLDDAQGLERALLGCFDYTKNVAVLHSDTRLMPKRKQVWASWNYIGEERKSGEGPLCVTYWMNRLQGLDASLPLFVTLNPSRDIDESKVHQVFNYAHPLFDAKAIAAQRQLWQLQGRNRTWFCGAHFGSGFHEDGLQSGLAVAEQLSGIARPWSVENQSGRIFVEPMLAAAQ
ncbi:FAD-dependent oxidoreductase [Agrobacterium vitis]|uniref:FAD-dependent oxidoreductase n=1 Tax=Agrobacterium vitis TaxID=373 RepID=A0AAE2UYT6_AGRVI|nr:FAD-dependent oxidoreductase [Agrobacterium vitis]MBF2717634.1 FAD-dependent oxidoreductase [Agrobacterium vitis]MUZ62786.1 FAD-dependent oxidoreductase [Agrobacterium vitis]MVA20335.1 FAD-dependent oxidoreductase [Agrobacterium vitis]